MIKDNTAEKVLEKIKGIKMKPRAFFIFKAVFFILCAVLVSLFCLFLFSFIVFACKASGACFVFGFGKSGLLAALSFFPWALVLALLSLFLFLELLIKRFSLAYKRPVIYSLAVIAFFIALGGILVDRTPLHPHLWERAEQNRLPFAGPLYFGLAERNPEQMHWIEITEMTETGFKGKNQRGEEVEVKAENLPQIFKEKDRAIVFGEKEGAVIKAQGIKKIDENFRIPPRMKRLPRMK